MMVPLRNFNTTSAIVLHVIFALGSGLIISASSGASTIIAVIIHFLSCLHICWCLSEGYGDGDMKSKYIVCGAICSAVSLSSYVFLTLCQRRPARTLNAILRWEVEGFFVKMFTPLDQPELEVERGRQTKKVRKSGRKEKLDRSEKRRQVIQEVEMYEELFA
ncbi:hypothetical protein DL96DRAFT_1585167 [Flagelloscypha sp. PMI_526]|nr:hypothetical protein DL96DRAFT_1585167 [Flagelloscypha sp. PMI_526]